MMNFQYIYEALSKHDFDLEHAVGELADKETPVGIIDFQTFKETECLDDIKTNPNINLSKRKNDMHKYGKQIKGITIYLIMYFIIN